MVEWSYIHPRKSTYQFQQGSAVENVSIWSLNLPSSRKLIVRFSAIFPALWPLTWHENCAKWGSSCYFIQLSAIYFKWWRKVIFVEKNTRSFRQDDQVTRHRQFREWRKTGVVPTVNHGLVQDSSISIANALEILQSYINHDIWVKPWGYPSLFGMW